MNKEKKRTVLILSLFSSVFVIVIIYLSYFQLFKAEDLRTHSYNKRLWINEENVLRGSIVDRNDNVLAYSEKNDDSNKRYYKYGRLYSHVIGYSYREYGKDGLELKYNNDLLAISDNTAFNEIKNLVLPNSVGHNLRLTIDHRLQERAHELLKKKKGSIVAMNPRTGEIYAMVSMPDFDTSNLQEDWKSILDNPEDPMFNRSTKGLYPPGSIFKVITTAAALEEGNMDLEYICKGSTTIDGYTINDYNKQVHGRIDLKQAFSKSCNTYFADKSLIIGKDSLGKIADNFMLNTNIPFDLSVKESKFDYKGDLGKTKIASSAYGQGDVLVTPLNMALMVSAIANEGKMVKPLLVKDVFDKNNSIVKNYRTEVLSESVSPHIAESIKEMMRETVKTGTGRNAGLKNVQVSGKTGTAQNASDNSHGWFVGFAPYDNPQIAVAIIVEEGGATGGEIAAPIARDIISYAINNINF